MTYTVTDLFCGAGGSGQGAMAVPGVFVAYAANHWSLAIRTHEANFPDTKHDHVNISQADPRRYRRTNILWASPECTNHSMAKGVKRLDLQPDLFDEIIADDAAATRSRATMWDVPRFAEVHHYDAVIVENVVDAAKWVMFDAWLAAMVALGYRYEIVYLNSMHAPAEQTPRSPQSRDRMYVVFTKIGNRKPILDIRPLAWCHSCNEVVNAMQSWKRPEYRWGRYRAQYVYRCPKVTCRFGIVEPFADPAAVAIDWTMPGQRIGDRTKPLSAKTIARIEAGLRKFAGKPMTFEARGNTFVRNGPDGRPVYSRAWPIDQPTATLTATETRALVVPVEGRDGIAARMASEPARTQTARLQDALVVPSGGTWNDDAQPVTEPLRTRTARESDALVVPYYGTGVAHGTDEPLPTQPTHDRFGVAFIAELRGGHSDARHAADPLATVTASGNHHMLVRHNGSKGPGGEMCTRATEPARTITTKGHQSIVGWPVDRVPDVRDCSFRMLEPSEIQRAMAFYDNYNVLGNRREKVRQLGNGVTPPAAEWLIRAVVDSLEGTAE